MGNYVDQSMNDKHAKPCSSMYPWLVWGLAAAFFFCEYFARVAPGVMVPELMKDFKVNALALGGLSAFFYYAYVSMQVPVGILVDRYGAHRLLTISTFIFGIGCILFGLAVNVYIAQLGRFLMGLSGAFAFVGSLKLASVWFPARRFGLLSGLTQALGMLGASIGEAPMSISVSVIGWRNTMLFIAIIFIILSFAIGFIVRDRPTNSSSNNTHSLAAGNGILAGLKEVLANRQCWLNALYAGFVYAPTAAFAELWGVTFLVQTHHLDYHSAALGVGLIFIGWGVGGPIIGWCSDIFMRRKPIMICSAATGLCLMSLILYAPLPKTLLFVLLFLYGISNTGVATAYAVATEINKRSVAGTSLAFANMASVIVGAAFQPIIGAFLEHHWKGEFMNGIPVYSATDFRSAMLLLPLSMTLGLIISFFVKETFCKAKE
ncbi:MAG: hypothetical protein LEGION0398_MBIBDBAK_00008 [Legionellaceae bacterium]